VAPAFPLRRRHEVLDRLPGDLAASAEEEEQGKQAHGGRRRLLLGEGARVRASLLFAMVVVRAGAAACCGVLYAVRSRTGVGVAIAASAARNLSHYLFSWVSRAPAPAILRPRPPASPELRRVV
jgi:hypothetical protein